MARTVSVPCGAVAVAYQDVTGYEEWEFEDYTEYLRETVKSHWPSFEDADGWLGREDAMLLENGHAYVGISEYCGLAAIWLVPKDDNEHPELSESWCEKIADKFETLLGEYRKVGCASNGECFYEKVS